MSFQAIYERYRDAAAPERSRLITEAIGETIPFVATAGVQIEAYTPGRVVVALPDREPVHNHVGTPHAAALALLAETATGLVVALNLQPTSVPLLRTMNVDFQRMARGRVTARASLDESEQSRLSDRPIGKIDVPVEVCTEEVVAQGTLQWAWIPESRL
jgi:acyl-coenzyme A thioesterase PaaI-like protein